MVRVHMRRRRLDACVEAERETDTVVAWTYVVGGGPKCACSAYRGVGGRRVAMHAIARRGVPRSGARAMHAEAGASQGRDMMTTWSAVYHVRNP